MHQHVGLAAASRGAGADLLAEGLTRNFRKVRFCLLTMFGSYEGLSLIGYFLLETETFAGKELHEVVR